MESNGAKRESMCVLPAKDAAELLQIKDILPHGTTANIQGTVTAVSEIIKINKDCVFMIELQGPTRIIVKQPQFHKWYDQLVIGKRFVFTNLRPTSLSEAYRPQQRVFIPWTGSCLLSSSEDNTSDLAVLDFQEWLSRLGLSLPKEGFCTENDDDDNDRRAGICNTVDFHQGVVTDSSQAEFGIFELEDKTRLFLCYVPKLKRPKEVYVGCCVTVYNVHTSVCSQTGKKQLFCCTRSTVHVADREEETSEKEGHTLPDPPVVTMVQQYAVLQSELSPLLQLYQDISQVMDLQHGDGTREKRKGVTTALKYLATALCCADRQRNYVMEFCQHQHFCPLRTTAADTDSLVPQLTSLTDILQDAMTTDEESPSLSGKISTSAYSDEEIGWRVTMKVVNKHALSWLMTNPATGHLQVRDSQQAINIVIVDSQRTTEPSSHHCHGLCDCSMTAKGARSQCPYFHPCCLGQLIVVNSFTVVSETFPDVKEGSGRNEEHKQRQVLYLVVDAQDCVRLKIDSQGKTSTSKSDHSLRKCATETTDHRNVSDADVRLVQITEKCHLAAQTTGGKRRSCVQFCAEGFFVTSNNNNHTDSESASAVTSVAAACDEAPPAKETCREYPAASKQLAVEEKKITSKVKETGKSSSTCQVEQSHHFSLPQGVQRGQPVSLTFEAGSCRWHDVIHPPGLYRFRGREGAGPFQWPPVDSRLQAAMERTGTQMAVKVSASASVERVFQDCGNNGQVISLPSLQSALSNGSPGQLVGFRGVVMWRRHPASQLQEIRTAARTVGDLGRTGQRGDPHMTLAGLLGTRSVCVGVKDEGDPSVTASVYISFSSLVYPLGLLPGAVVDFHRLEKKTSKANNVYFSFLPVSSLSVVSAPSFGAEHKRPAVNQQQSAANRNVTPHWDDAPHWLLIDLWRQPEVPDVFVVTCHVCQFFRLSLKSVCGQCGSLFQPDGCSAPACHNTHHSVLLPRIRILVEDGSGQAVVDINKSCPDAVTRRLLKMSSTQWPLLEQAVQQQGEVFLQKFGGGGGTAIEDLLSLLCDSRRIKRPCRLMVRKPLYSNKPGKTSTALLEALTAGELVTRNINTGEGMVETLCLPYQSLDCLDMQDI